MEQKEFYVDNLINEIYNEFSWVFADNKKYIKLVNIIQKNINELQEENEKLKTELAEKDKQLRLKTVVPKIPKYRIGQKIYYVMFSSFFKYNILLSGTISASQYNNIENVFYYELDCNLIDKKAEYDIYSTIKKAEQKLKEMEEVSK